jgi:arylsulfatase
LPKDQGFDEWYGIPRTTDEAFWPSDPQARAANVPLTHLLEGRKGQPSTQLAIYDMDRRRVTDEECTSRAIDFMKRSVAVGKPFYAYVPYTQVHFPALPNPKFMRTLNYYAVSGNAPSLCWFVAEVRWRCFRDLEFADDRHR